MNTPKLITLITLSLAVAAPAVLAQNGKAKADPATQVEKWFQQYDKDGDGKLTAAEFGLGRSYFEGLDIDRNGSVTRDEATKAMSMQPVDPSSMDADRDGYITRREWTGDQAGFDKLDLDNDGVLSKVDRQIEADQNRAQKRMKSLDKNGDGIVQRAEWPGNDESFRKQDQNRNGSLSLDELGDRNRRK